MSALDWAPQEQSPRDGDLCKSDLIGKTSREVGKWVRKRKEVKQWMQY